MKPVRVLWAGPHEPALAAALARRYPLMPCERGALALGATALRIGAAIVHLHASLAALARPGALAKIAAARLAGAAAVCELHGGEPPPRPLPLRLRAGLRAADALVVPSAAEARAYHEALPSQLAVHIAPGIAAAPFQRYNRAPLSSDTPVRLVYLGRLAPEQGLPEALEALRLVLGQGLAARLVIAGTGPEEARLRHQAADAGVARQVTFAGVVEGEQRARLLSQSDLLLLPVYRAGVPRVLLEAMAAGTVPIASAVGGVPEVLGEEHGLLIEPRDALAIAEAIMRVARDRSRLARMSGACRQRVAAAFSLERRAAELAALYFTLAGAPRERGAVKGAP